MAKNDGGPAFPDFSDAGYAEHSGMSRLDYFAAAALPECVAASLQVARENAGKDVLEHISTTMARAAFWADEAARAMLAERSKAEG